MEGGGFGDPYVRLAILPEVDERIRQSSVKRKTCNPFYNEYFKFPLTIDDVRDRTLVFHIYDYDKFSRHKIIGEVQVDLSKVDVTNSVEMWCDILKHQKVGTEVRVDEVRGQRAGPQWCDILKHHKVGTEVRGDEVKGQRDWAPMVRCPQTSRSGYRS